MIQRRAALAAASVLVACLVAVPATAQDPSAPVAATADPATPTPVEYVDGTGVTRGSVLVRSVEDPFTGFDPGSPPPEGQRYVLLTVVFEAAMDQSFASDPYHIQVQDSDGFIRTPSWVPRAQPVTVPDLQSQTLAPGDRVSGAIGYVVPASASLATIQYVPEYNRYIPLQRASDLPGPAVGEAVTFTDVQGVTHGTAMIREITDPFTGHDPGSPPPAGSRFVMLIVEFQAADDQALWADPYGVLLQDANGYLLNYASVYRPPENVMPDLQSQTLAPGDRISGYLGFVLPEATAANAILWSPESGRLLPLLDIGG